MKKSILLVVLAAALPLACARQKEADTPGQPTTQTIAPAAAKPAPTSGTDATTQTVDIEDSRSEEEGAAARNPRGSATTTGAKTPTPKKKKGRR